MTPSPQPTASTAHSLEKIDSVAVVTGTTRVRFVALALFVLFGLCTQMQFVAFSPIVRHVEDRTGASSLMATMLTAVVTLVFVAALLPALFTLRRFGLRAALLLGATAGAIGAAPKPFLLMWWPNVYALLLCQIAVGVAQACFTLLPAQFAATWFPSSERALATAVCTLSSFLGIGLGFLVPPLVVTAGWNGGPAFATLFGVIAALAASACCGIAAAVPAAPALPPSVTAPQVLALQRRAKSLSLPNEPFATVPLGQDGSVAGVGEALTRSHGSMDTMSTAGSPVPASPTTEVAGGDVDTVFGLLSTMWALRSNVPFVILTAAFGLFNGFFIAFANVMAQAMEPLHVSERHVGAMTFVGLVIGSGLAVVAGVITDRLRRYSTPLAALYIALASVATVAALLLQFDAVGDTSGGVNAWVPIMYVVVTALAALNCATFPVAFEFMTELVHPAPPIAATTPAVALNNVSAFVFSAAMAAVLTDTPTLQRSAATMWACVALLAAAAVAAWAVPEHRRRFDEENSAQPDSV